MRNKSEPVSESKLHLLRGPVLVVAAILTVVWPYLTAQVVWCVTVVSLGCALFLMDLFTLGEETLRINLAKFLDGLVLDDILRAIYDPENGIIATAWMTWLANSVGCISMYSMKMNEEQRTELFQAGYQVEKETARTMLMDRGGIKWLLDDSVREWIYRRGPRTPAVLERETPKQTYDKIEVETVEIEAVETEILETDSETSETDFVPAGFKPRGELSKNLHGGETTEDYQVQSELYISRHKEIPPDPVATLQNIVMSIFREQLKSYILKIPESAVEKVASTATSLFVAQVCWKTVFRSKVTVWNSILPALTLGALTGSVGALVARDVVGGKLQGANSAKTIAKAVAAKILQQVKAPAMRRILAVFVLFLAGKTRLRQRRKDHPLYIRPIGISSPLLHK